MKKVIVSLFIIASAMKAQAQTIGNSPYASYGIGDVKYGNYLETNSMAGISTAYVWDFNNQFNFKNPAANRNLDLASIKVQGTNENQYFKSDYNNTKYNKHSTYLSGLSLAFPINNKVKMGVHFQPYSSKDYNITRAISLPSGVNGTQVFSGHGSINIVQAGLGYSISPTLSVGLSSNYYFGRLYDNEETTFENAPLINNHENIVSVNTFNFTLGSVYQKTLKNNRKLTFGATYTFGNTSQLKYNYVNSTYALSNTNERVNQTIIHEQNKTIKNPLAQELSIGAGYGHDGKWFISSQFNYKSGSSYDTYIRPFEYQNAYRVALGGWYLPNYNNFRNYFSRITYRYGVFYEKGNLRINDTNVNKYGIAFGGSFPFQKSNIHRMSSIDLGVELGQRGSLKNNLVRENFLNLTIGINFANKWFEKQYYD